MVVGAGGRGREEGERERKKQRSPSRSRSRSPKEEFRTPPSTRRQPADNAEVNRLIKALNDGDANNATNIARQLARNKEPIRFALDMINESGNEAPRPPPQPVQEPIRYIFLLK